MHLKRLVRQSLERIIIAALLIAPAYAACTPGAQSPSVTVCQPAVNSIVNTPAHIVAATTDSHTVTSVQVYVDNQLVQKVSASTIDTYIPLALGKHLVTVQAWDNTGATFKTNVPVAMTPPCTLSTTVPSVTICTPNGGAVSQPMHLVAGFNDPNPITSVNVLIDGVSTYTTNASPPLDIYLSSLKAGSRAITVTATDSTGAVFSKQVSVRVTNQTGLSNLRHIIFEVQENRSFDNYFGMLGRYRVSKGLPNSIDGLNLNTKLLDSSGVAVQPFHFQTVCHENLSPYWNEAHIDVDGGKMDNFMKTALPSTIDPTGTRAMGYYDQTDLPYYYEVATQFATSDRFFSPVLTNTNSNRMYLFAGTSFGHINNDVPPSGGWIQPTIFDHLDAAGVSWRYYYQDNGSYLPQWTTYQRDASKLKPIANYYTDLQNEATLPSVIFIERPGPSGLDEHPGENIQLGAANNRKLINALIASPSWGSSVFIVTYDEGGALYDHVVPATLMLPDKIAPMLKSGDQPGDFAHSGARIPLMVISPWVKPHLVSHVWRDITSILKLIEVRFTVQPLTARDAAADDMEEFFDFSSAHWLNPPALPDQPTNGVCNNNLEKAPGR